MVKFFSTKLLFAALLALHLHSTESFTFHFRSLVGHQSTILKYKSGEDDAAAAKLSTTTTSVDDDVMNPTTKSDESAHKNDPTMLNTYLYGGVAASETNPVVTTKQAPPTDTKKYQPTIMENVLDGKAGARGEGFVAVQGFLMLCILGGGIPIVGGSLMFLLGPGLFLVGAIIMILAINDMGSSLSPWPKPASNAKLVTDGLFSKMRHPIYAGLCMNLAGLSIATGSVERLLLTGLLLWTLAKKTEYEEQELQKKFPGDYESYMKKVPGRFFPDK
jgi:protein-S-isoprenylcysteine O-methyltransferase Ste14